MTIAPSYTATYRETTIYAPERANYTRFAPAPGVPLIVEPHEPERDGGLQTVLETIERLSETRTTNPVRAAYEQLAGDLEYRAVRASVRAAGLERIARKATDD